MSITIDGLATGLNTTDLIERLTAIERRRITLFQANQDRVRQQQSAFKTIEARLLTVRAQLSQLARSQSGVFQAKGVESSDTSLVTATAGSSATPGIYTLRVSSLARNHQIASQGFASLTSTITQGTVQIQVGTGGTSTITMDSTNNTLQGLANAINSSAAGVTATIINDGSDSRTHPYRLLITANSAGASNAIMLTNNLGADAGGAIKPVFSGTYINPAVTAATYAGTSTPTSNNGAGGYTGSANDTYTFTVTTGGTVGVDNGIQITFADGSGENSGTITLNSGDADVFKSVAEGVQVKLRAGTLVAAEKFTVDVFATTVQQATSASVLLGSGSGALSVQSETNRVDGVIPGVSLNLLGANATKDVQITVSSDTKNAKQAVLDFVDAYNELMAYIDEQVRYEAETGRAGILLGNSLATTIQDQVRRIVVDTVSGLATTANRLSAVGITTNSQGRLEVNHAKLDDALAGRISGVTLDDIYRLLALAGKSTNAGVRFVTAGTKTNVNGTTIEVDLTQAAEQAVITATNALAAATVIDATHNTLSITVDGKTSGTITLASGTYTRLALAAELQAKINADSTLLGTKVAVSVDNDHLKITSERYGVASEVTIGSGSALGVLGFAGTETDRGQDVVGSFLVNGVTEPAVGTGQILVGTSGNANTADLQVLVTLSSAQIVAGAEASLTVTRGVASRLDQLLNGMLDPVTGRMKSINDNLQRNVDALQTAIKRQNEILQARQAALVRQFAAMEAAVSQLRSTSEFLTAQLLSVNSLRVGGSRAT